MLRLQYGNRNVSIDDVLKLYSQKSGKKSKIFEISIYNDGDYPVNIMRLNEAPGGRRAFGWFIRIVEAESISGVIEPGKSRKFKVAVFSRKNSAKENPTEPGIYTARYELEVKDHGGVLNKHKIRLVSMVKDKSIKPVQITKNEFFEKIAYMQFTMGAGTRTSENPYSLNLYVLKHGHLKYVENKMMPVIEWVNGRCRGFIQRPFGNNWGTSNSNGDLPFDAKLHLEKSDNPVWYETIEQAFDKIDEIPGFTWMPYFGTLRQDRDFINAIIDKNYDYFFDRVWKSIDIFMSKKNVVGVGLDVPYNDTLNTSWTNPLIKVGEPRYEIYRMFKRLMEIRGGKVYVEPRIPGDTGSFTPEQGWNSIVAFDGWQRSNPDWFSTSKIKDSRYKNAETIQWISHSDYKLMVYQMAEVILLNQVVGHKNMHQLVFAPDQFLHAGISSDQMIEDINYILEEMFEF